MKPVVSIGANVDLRQLEERLGLLAARVVDLRPVFHGPVDAFTSQIFREQFESRGARLNGVQWAPLSVTTIRMRTRVVSRRMKGGITVLRTTNRVGQARAGFATPLRNTNRLFASFVKSGGPEGVREITPQTYERGSRLHYAALQNNGFIVRSMFGQALKSPRRVPARVIVPQTLPNDVTDKYAGFVGSYIYEGTL